MYENACQTQRQEGVKPSFGPGPALALGQVLQTPNQSEIQRELECLHTLTAELHEVISNLSMRLDPVRIEDAKTAGGVVGGPAANSGFGRALQQGNAHTANAIARLRQLTAELAI